MPDVTTDPHYKNSREDFMIVYCASGYQKSPGIMESALTTSSINSNISFRIAENYISPS